MLNNTSSQTDPRLVRLLTQYNGKNLLELLESQDPHLKDHQKRVACMACKVAREMGLSEEQIEAIYIAASLHDIGMQEFKVSAGSSPSNQLKIMERFREHPVTGAELLRDISLTVPVDEIVLQHHERLDGSGFPRQISDVMVESQIIAIVDILDGIYSIHSSRPQSGLQHACDELEKMRDGLLDPSIVDMTITLAQDYNLIGDCSS